MSRGILLYIKKECRKRRRRAGVYVSILVGRLGAFAFTEPWGGWSSEQGVNTGLLGGWNRLRVAGCEISVQFQGASILSGL